MNESTRDKLQRLLGRSAPGVGPREEARADVAAPPDGASAGASSDASRADALPHWVRARLARGLVAQPDTTGAGRSVGEPDALSERSGTRGVFAERVHALPDATRHGDFRLNELEQASAESLALLACEARMADVDWRGAVHLDIETTGLGGGAGTHCFMIGLGRFRGDRFELWQGFLRHPGEAAALLAECASRVAESTGVVSFFGKSFDRHRLEDAMRLHGVDPPFEQLPHLDLYYACRRVYGPAYDDGRLATMERALCGVQREDDLSGAFAPAAWFDYQAGRAHQLEGVFEHNYLDVLSLVTLTAHLGRIECESRGDGGPLGGPADARARGLAALHARERRREHALEWLERARERAAPREHRTLDLERAHLLRLTGELESARALFARLHEDANDPIACEALLETIRLRLRMRDTEGLEAQLTQARTWIEGRITGSRYARWSRELTKFEERCARRVDS